jgi:hypothetical protein
MLASFPASMLNQNQPDLGILYRFRLDPSRSSVGTSRTACACNPFDRRSVLASMGTARHVPSTAPRPYVTTPDALKWGIHSCSAGRWFVGATSRWCAISDGSDAVCRAWRTHRCVSAFVGGVTAGNVQNRWADSAGPLFGARLLVVDGLRRDGCWCGEWSGTEHLGRARAVDDDDLQSGE